VSIDGQGGLSLQRDPMAVTSRWQSP